MFNLSLPQHLLSLNLLLLLNHHLLPHMLLQLVKLLHLPHPLLPLILIIFLAIPYQPTNLQIGTESPPLTSFPANAPTLILHHHMTTRLQAGTWKPKPFPHFKLYFSTKHSLMILHSKVSFLSYLLLPPNTLKLLNLLTGNKLCRMNSIPFKPAILWPFALDHLRRTSSPISGSTKWNRKLMELLKVGWLVSWSNILRRCTFQSSTSG